MTPPPTIADRRPEVVTREIPSWREGWTTAATSADHKVVAKLFMGTSLSFLAIAALAFALTRIQLIVPDSTIIRPDIFSQMSTTAMASITVLFGVPFVARPPRLHRPASDRRPQRRPPPPQPARLLALCGRRRSSSS